MKRNKKIKNPSGSKFKRKSVRMARVALAAEVLRGPEEVQGSPETL